MCGDFNYHVRRTFDVRASYELGVTEVDFTGDTTRVDVRQTLTIGVVKGF